MEEEKRKVPARKSDWETLDMPEMHAIFSIRRPFSEAEMEILKMGHIPEEMEDKWFWYFEDGKLYIHRSWTGICIYILTFTPGSDVIRVIANRNPEQYKCTDDEEDAESLLKLLGWWTNAKYDYYSEWLSETLDMIKKAKFSIRREKLKAENKTTEAIYFGGPNEQHGFLSNSYPCVIHIGETQFSSVEQYMLYYKYASFGYKPRSLEILGTKDSAQLREFDVPFRDYQELIWNGRRQIILMQALYQKFDQNRELGDALLNTGDAFLVACAQDDKTWTCGAAISDDARLDIGTWSGKNLLGSTLIEVRKALRREKAKERKSALVMDVLDITKLDCDCIVNAANSKLLNSGCGVDGAIHQAAGPELARECLTLGGCGVGEAKITSGYRLPAKWVIHTVGPVYSGQAGDAKLLADCYRNSLDLARKHGIHSIAFPAISTGTYKYPLKEAAAVALTTVRNWLVENKDYIMDVILCCSNKQMHEVYCSYAEENHI